MFKCSYCFSQNPTDLLLCCLTITCNSCVSSHPCLSSDSIPLNSKHPTLKMCRRCNLTPITHKCNDCKKFYCKSCKNDIHKGKLAVHQIIEIDKIQKGAGIGTEVVCGRHQLKRNMILENGNIGCVRCADEFGLKKIGIIDQCTGKGLSVESLRQILQQKRNSLEHEKNQIDSKWQIVQKSAKSIFTKLIEELQQRQQYTLQRINIIKNQQLSTINELISIASVQKSSLEGIQKLHINNKDKLLKLKLISVDESMKIIDKKKRIPQYHIGKLETDSLVSAIKGLVNIQRVKEQPVLDRKRSSDILESNRKDRRSQSRDVLSRSRMTQSSQSSLYQSGMKTRQNSAAKLNIPIQSNFERKLVQSVVISQPSVQKQRMKSQVIKTVQTPTAEQMKKTDQLSQKFKTNFLQMKQNIRKSGNYFNQKPLTRR